MAMKNPPRRTTIRGQKHLLAYITPEEADVLKAMGGSGEKVHGIPAFYGGFDDDRTQAGEGPSGGYDDADDKDNKSDNNDGQPMGMSPGAMGGKIGSSYQKAPSVGGGFDVNLNKAMTQIAMAPPSQKLNWVDRAIMKAYQNRTQPGLLGDILGLGLGRTKDFTLTGDPRKGIFSGFSNQAPMIGTLGFLGQMFPSLGEKMYVRTGFDTGPMFDDGKGRDDTVPASYNPDTGEAKCPDGYMFDEDLQACRLAGGLPGGDGTTGYGELGPATGDLYGRMGLLDIAPTGLGMFKQRFGAGFGTPSDFDTANMAFRRSGGVQRPYPGYTLLS